MSIIQPINSNNISQIHLNQLIELAISTAYFHFVGLNKSVEYDYKERVKRYFVIPYLSYTKVILDELNNIAGYYVALPKSEDDRIISEDTSKYTSPDDILMFKAFATLYNKISPNSFMLNFFAVRFDLQGLVHPKHNEKISKILFNQILLDFKESHCSELVLLTWEKYLSANKFYKKHGAYIADSIDLTNTIYNDRILMMKISNHQL